MNKIAFHFLGGLVTASMLLACLAIISFALGWGMFSVVLFWIIMVPIIAYVSAQIFRKNNLLITAVTGVVIFYAAMFFLTYKLYETDFFAVMEYSLATSLFVIVTYHYYAIVFDKIFPPKVKHAHQKEL
jgi:hypothetical protein